MRHPNLAAVAMTAVGVAVLAGAHYAKPYLPDTRVAEVCEQQVHGACIVYAPGAPRIPDERFEGMFRAAAEHWGSGLDVLDGYTVVVKGRDPYPFGDLWIWGVTIPELRRLDFATPQARCPDLVFLHEWGHAAGVLGHSDPRFEDAAILATLVQLEVTGCRV